MSVTRMVARRSAMAALLVAQLGLPEAAWGQRERFLPPAVVNAQLDSLERIVLTSPDADERRSAVTRISAPGWMRSGQPTEVRYPGVVARLARLYQQTNDYWTRYSIIRLLIPQVERAEAAALLERIAQEPGPPPAPPGVALVEDKWSLQEHAIGALNHLGTEGEAILRRLHARGAVQERTARAALERLAREGFRQRGGSF